MVARASTPKATRQRRNTNPAPAAKATHAQVVQLPRMFTVDELAEIFHCSNRTITRMMDEGQLPAVKIRRQRLVAAPDLERFLEERVG